MSQTWKLFEELLTFWTTKCWHHLQIVLNSKDRSKTKSTNIFQTYLWHWWISAVVNRTEVSRQLCLGFQSVWLLWRGLCLSFFLSYQASALCCSQRHWINSAWQFCQKDYSACSGALSQLALCSGDKTRQREISGGGPTFPLREVDKEKGKSSTSTRHCKHVNHGRTVNVRRSGLITRLFLQTVAVIVVCVWVQFITVYLWIYCVPLRDITSNRSLYTQCHYVEHEQSEQDNYVEAIYLCMSGRLYVKVLLYLWTDSWFYKLLVLRGCSSAHDATQHRKFS